MLRLFLYVTFILFLVFPVEAEKKKFRFCISAPLSGVLAEYGRAVVNGLDLAKADYEEKLKSIQIFMEDSQWDAKTAVSAYSVLRDQRKCDLIYNWGNPTSEAVAPLAKLHKQPTLVMSSDPAITKNNPFVIRSLRSGEELGSLLAEYLFSNDVKNVAVAVAEVSYVLGLYKGMEKYFAEHGGNIEFLGRFPLDVQDFRSTILKYKSGDFDAVGVFLISGQVSSFYRQFRDQGLKAKSFGADFLGSENEIAQSGPAIQGAVFPDLAVEDAFRKRYLEEFGNDIQIAFAANAYDVLALVAEVFSEEGSSDLSVTEIMNALRRADTIHGAHGTFQFKESEAYGPAFVAPTVIRKVAGKSIVEVLRR